jgi:hypothetical protein
MNNLPPRLEKYDKEGWYRYLHRAVHLKNAPNLDLDMNVFTRCIVGRCRKGAIYFSKIKSPETYCIACKEHSQLINMKYGELLEKSTDSEEFYIHLDWFFDHLEKIHS